MADFGIGEGAAAASAASAASASAAASTSIFSAANLAAAASAVSGIVGAVGSINAGNAQADALRANAAVAKTNAGTSLSSSEADAARLQDQARRTVAAASNQFGASGVDPTTGSPLDVLADQTSQGALNAEIARWRGTTQANAYLTNSANLTTQAGNVQTAADISAGTGLLTSAVRTATALTPRSGYVPNSGYG